MIIRNQPTQSPYIYLLILLMLFFYLPEAFAVKTVGLKEPMQNLKVEAFEWMFAIKIAAVAVGGAFSLIKQSLTPFGIGAGITAGVTFFDKLIGDGSAALIG